MNLTNIENPNGSAGHLDTEPKSTGIMHNANSSSAIFEEGAVVNANSSGRLMATDNPSGNGCATYSAMDLLAESSS